MKFAEKEMRENIFVFSEIISLSVVFDSALLLDSKSTNFLKNEFLYIKIKMIK